MNRTISILVLLLGLAFLGVASFLVVGYAITPSQARSPVAPVSLFGVLGLWCTIGAIANLRSRRTEGAHGEPRVTTYVLVQWNAAILTTSLAGTILSFFLENNPAPDPGPWLRTFGIVLIVSILSVPVVLIAYLVEKSMRRLRART